ncbi:unnamed protein product [Rotaria sordida]|uniref:STI1/HOP DP domain-containing protein n=1 Tax=Rotaria sordida TaxID=392033 RepID=A0A814PF70_9BILA|nr:unnamed protein product [Rotaria sordida]
MDNDSDSDKVIIENNRFAVLAENNIDNDDNVDLVSDVDENEPVLAKNIKVCNRALADPEIQQILSDPSMRLILDQMQNEPLAIHEHLRNPVIA